MRSLVVSYLVSAKKQIIRKYRHKLYQRENNEQELLLLPLSKRRCIDLLYNCLLLVQIINGNSLEFCLPFYIVYTHVDFFFLFKETTR